MKTRIFQTLIVAASFSPPICVANPVEPTVMAGDAAFLSINPSTLEIQSKDGTVIHWDSFSIDLAETTRFLLPTKDAAVLNRVMGNLPSAIAGALESNGKVFLINPNGILVTETGVINTASFIASTLDAHDIDFLTGKTILWKGDTMASIQNLGTIIASEGDLFLIAHTIDNQGELKAENGVVGLGAGSEVLLKMSGDERIFIKTNATLSEDGEEGIVDSGWIKALQAEIKADGTAYSLGVNHSGKIEALGVEEKDGRILLVADRGIAASTGELIAKNSDGTGGTVHVLGEKVALLEDATVDVSGELDGGTVLIGGDYQGQNKNIPNAKVTYIDKDVLIDVSSKENGDGGKSIAWSDGICSFFGTVDAQGGKQSGNGGLVEVSGKQHLDFEGFVNTSAPFGETGTLLLDPTNIVIDAGGVTNTYMYVPGVGGTVQFLSSLEYDITAALAFTTITPATIIGALGGTNVVIQSMPDTLIATAGAPTTLLGLGQGDITLLDGTVLMGAPANSLTLNAAHNIYFHGEILYAGGSGDVNLVAGEEIRLESFSTMSTVPPRIDITGMAAGQGNISARAKTIRVFNNFDDMGAMTPGGFHTSTGSITLHAADGDITIEGGHVSSATSHVLADSGSISITAVNGSLNVLGSQVPMMAMTSPAIIEATAGDILINADLGCNVIGGRGILSQAEILAGGSINLTTDKGDVIVSGTPEMMGGGSPGQIIAGQVFPLDLVINANNGNVVVSGGLGGGSPGLLQSGSTMMMTGGGNVSINAYGTGGVSLLGGDGPGMSSAQIRTFLPASGVTTGSKISINAHNGSLNLTGSQASGGMGSFAQVLSATSISFYTGFDCNLTGGIGGGISQASIEATTGIDGVVNGSLNLLGGGDPMMPMGTNPAFISNTTGNLNLSIGANLNLFAGPVLGSFAQIGCNDAAAMTIDSNIVISKVGGDVTLIADRAMMGGTGNYAAIGHGNTAGGMAGFITGDIVFSNGIGGNLIMRGGLTQNMGAFSQIGHFGIGLGMGLIQGNIRVNEVGNSIILDGGFDYALIGHGNNIMAPNQVVGDITVYSSTGNCTFEQSLGVGATDVFCQIGHIGSMNVEGDINVHVGEALQLNANGSMDSLAIIGHGNPSLGGMTSFNGNIDVDAETIQLLAGNAAGAHAQIGMYQGNIPADVGMSNPRRNTIDVQAVGNIDLQAGGPTVGAGNALIGWGPDMFDSTITIDNITVTSTEGNITLNGGSDDGSFTGGVAAIGVFAMPGAALNNPHQSDLTVNCPNGALTLNGILPGLSTAVSNTTGVVLIQNGLPTMTMEPISPFNVTINAAEVMLNTGGSSTFNMNLGTVFLASSRKMTVKTSRDFEIVSPNGFVQVTAAGDLTFDIGHDMSVEGNAFMGGGANQISTFFNGTPNQFTKMDFDIGNDLIMKSNITGASNFEIGPAAFTAAGQTSNMNFRIGHDLIMQGGSGGMGGMGSLGIGTAILTTEDQTSSIRFDIGDNVNMTAGSGNGVVVAIGPAAMTAQNQLVDINMKAGGDFLLRCGSDMTGNSALIGFTTMTMNFQTMNMNFDIGGNMVLDGNESMTSLCQIGPASMMMGPQNFTLNANVGSDLMLLSQGMMAGGSVLIGPTSLMGGFQNVSMNFTTGGNLNLQSETGTFCVIGTDPMAGTGISSSFSNFLINCNVGKDLILNSVSGPVLIGPRDISMNDNNCEMSFLVDGKISIRNEQPGSYSGIGLDPTLTGLSGTNQRMIVDCQANKSLFMQPNAPMQNCFIGPYEISGNNCTSTTRVTTGGDALLLSAPSVGMGNRSIIGPETVSGDDHNVLVEANSGGDLLLRLESANSSHVYLGAPNLAGQRISLAVNVTVDKDLILDAGPSENSFCQIGPQVGMNSNQNFDLNFRVGGDVTLYGGTNMGMGLSEVLIGSQLYTGANSTGKIHFDIGGDLTLLAKTGISCPCQIGVRSASSNTATDIIFDRIGGDVNLIPGSGGASWVHIGHGPGGPSPVGNILFHEVAGDFLVGVPSPGFTPPGGTSYAQVGHVAGNIIGDVFVQAAGNLVLQAGNGTNASAIIGHGNAGINSISATGNIRVRAASANLTAANLGGFMGANAVVGFDNQPGMFTVNSNVVELLSQGEIYLTGNQGTNAVIGYFEGGSTTDVTIDMINASAMTGNIFLDGGAGGMGTAIIGTRSAMGTCHSNVKVTAGRDLILFANAGSALVVNNQVAPATPEPAYTTSIDPISVILLGGSMGGTADITSSGNVLLNFDDRLDINFDSFGGMIQAGNANVTAGGDVEINVLSPSLAPINIQGAAGAFTSAITATGNVYIGRPSNPGAGDVNVGFVDGSTGAPTITSGLGTQIYAAGDINVQGGGGASSIASAGDISLFSEDNVTLNGTGSTAQVVTSGGSIDITAANNILGSTNAGFLATNGALASEIALDAGVDVRLQNNAVVTNSGTGSITIDAGQDLFLAGTSSITNAQSGSAVIIAGRDATVSGGTAISNAGPGSIEMFVGRDANNFGAISSAGGSLVADAGRDVNNSGTITSGGGSFVADAGRDVNNQGAATIGVGNFDFDAERNINNTGTLTNSTGAFLLDAVTNINHLGGSMTSTAGNMSLNAGRTIQSSAPLIVSSGAGNIELTAKEYVNVAGGITHSSSGTVAMTAGDDVNIGSSVTSATGDIQMNAVRNINMTGGTMSTGGQQIIYGNARNNFNMSGAAAIIQSGGPPGETLLIAGRDMNILGAASITSPGRGFITLVVDDLFPDPPKYGRGLINTAGGATINNSGGEIRLFTSRQPFNSISSALNGAAFVPGTPYVDTTQETWDSYYYRSLVGAPFMVFYKDTEPSVTPIPPEPPITPVTPDVPIDVLLNIPFKFINQYWTAIAEAIRNWENYDEFNFGTANFEFIYHCALGDGGQSLSLDDESITSGSASESCQSGTQSFHFLREGYRNYHTKKLDTKY